MSKLLIDEYPLQVLPQLAKAIGLNEAIFLQQLHYWLTPEAARKYKPHYREWEGKRRACVFNTYERRETKDGRVTGWEANFPFWSVRTIKRIVANLREKKLIITTDEFNKSPYDHTLWYTIDYDELDRLSDNLSLSAETECHDEDDILAESSEGQPGTNISETPTETNTETNTESPADPLLPFSDDPTAGLPRATDGHQRAVDGANGAQAPDPVEQVTLHHYQGFMGAPEPLPDKKRERAKWTDAGRRLLNFIPQPWDVHAVCAAVDCWWADGSLDEFWKDKPRNDNTLELIAKYVKNGGKHGPNQRPGAATGRPGYRVADPPDHAESERIKAEIHAGGARDGPEGAGGMP